MLDNDIKNNINNIINDILKDTKTKKDLMNMIDFLNNTDILKKLISIESLKKLVRENDDKIELDEDITWEKIFNIYIDQKIKNQTDKASNVINKAKDYIRDGYQ